MPKKSGKDTGSLTQKADSQQVRISQVSNVSQAVNAMGKETTRRMKETDRKIAEGGDSKEIAGSMNGVLNSLKSTIDSLNKGVEAATLGTAKAATDAIKQYGTAISSDININKQNMVASAMATSTPIFGYFASKFMETGIFKKTKDKMSEGISNIFRKKSKGGSMPDSFDDDMDSAGGAGGAKVTPAQVAQKQKQFRVVKKKDSLDNLKLANRDQYETYGKETENKTLLALTAIQTAVGAQVGKFDQWYGKFLLQHPYYRTARTAFKAMNATFGTVWKAVYAFWRPRGGYKKHLSKSKQPFTAINQNLGAIFVQTMPRLDAIMIYTKATAIAVRDLSSHVTGKKYGMMDPSKLGGTWSLAGVTMAILRGAGRLAMKGARKLNKSMFLEGSRASNIFEGMISGTETLGKIADYSVTGPGRFKEWAKKKTLGQLPGAKEQRRLFGGLEGTEVSDVGFGKKKEQKCLPIYFCQKKNQKRLPKQVKGMGPRIKPDLIVQNVYDIARNNKEKKKEKYDKKLLGYTANSAKFLKEHDKREKRRTVMGMLGGIFSGAKGILGSLFGLLGGLFGGLTGGIGGFITGLATNPAVWAAIGVVPALIGTTKIWDWLDKKFGDGGTLSNTIFTGFRNAFPQFDIQSSVMSGVSGGIGRLFKGEDFNFKQVMKDSINSLWDKKFGVGFSDWWKVFTGNANEDEKKALYNKQMEKKYGEDRYAIELKERRLAEAKGFKETGKAYLGLVAGKLKSKLGMDVGESEAAVTALRAQKLVEKYGGNVEDYLTLKYKDAVVLGKKIWAESQKKLTAAKDRLSAVTKVTMADAKELAVKYGGHAREYVNKTFPEAKSYGLKLQEKAAQAKAYIKDQAAKAEGYTTKKLKELSATEWAQKKGLKLDGSGGRLVDAIEKQYGKGQKFTAEQWNKVKKWAEEEDLVLEGSGGRLMDKAKQAPGWFGRQWEAMKKWGTGGGPETALKKSGEYIELGKGNFVEIYRQGAGNIKEFWETATPEKKAWIRQNADRLLASGQVTADELKKMGIQIKDATLEGAEKVVGGVVASSINTTNNITSAVSQMSSGGGGNQSKMMMEPAMDEIAMGNVEN